MFNIPIYLSAPDVKFAQNCITNDQIIEKVFSNFNGTQDEWKKIKVGISFVFKYCNTQVRFLGLEEGKSPIDYAIEVAERVCESNQVDPTSIDLVIYGGVYREYFEPATAMEIAARLGIKKVSAFDVTDACAGLLQSVQVAASLMRANNRINTALCCTTDFPDEAINYDIQSFADLSFKSAGLTLGGGSSAWLLTKKPLKNGGARLLDMQNTSLPNSYNICKVPVDLRKFQSSSKEIFDLGLENVPIEINNILERIGWKISDIDYFIAHQPSKKIIQNICHAIGVPIEKAPIIHHLYGNTINSSIPMTMDHILKTTGLINGNKLIFNAAAAGFSMVTGAAIWEC